MAKLLLLAVCVSVASAGLADLRSSHHSSRPSHHSSPPSHHRSPPSHHSSHRSPDPNKCVDISRYGEVQYKEESFTLSGYVCDNVGHGWNQQSSNTCERKCETKKEEICQNVEITSCEVQGYADCDEQSEWLTVDETETLEFIPKRCWEDGTQELTDFEEVPDCKQIWKKQCDSVWVFGHHGAREEKQENCKDVEIEDCTLIRKPVTTSYPKYHCADDHPITYLKKSGSKNINVYSKKCQVRSRPVCQTKTERKCDWVSFEECAENYRSTSNVVTTRIPSQDFDHRLKCIVEH